MHAVAVKLKFWFFSHHWWILLIAGLVIIFSLAQQNSDISASVAVGGTLLSVFYFLQKQKLEEIHLFRDLFKEFNKRYDNLNETLAAIAQTKDTALSMADRETLIDYFNLCGEEYFYFTKGYIHPKVWDAWGNGMNYCFSNDRVWALWEKEMKTDSYYELEKWLCKKPIIKSNS